MVVEGCCREDVEAGTERFSWVRFATNTDARLPASFIFRAASIRFCVEFLAASTGIVIMIEVIADRARGLSRWDRVLTGGVMR